MHLSENHLYSKKKNRDIEIESTSPFIRKLQYNDKLKGTFYLSSILSIINPAL